LTLYLPVNFCWVLFSFIFCCKTKQNSSYYNLRWLSVVCVWVFIFTVFVWGSVTPSNPMDISWHPMTSHLCMSSIIVMPKIGPIYLILKIIQRFLRWPVNEAVFVWAQYFLGCPFIPDFWHFIFSLSWDVTVSWWKMVQQSLKQNCNLSQIIFF